MMQRTMPAVLKRENDAYRGRSGVSVENRSLGFVPAFMDSETGAIYRSRFAGGQPAPIHVLDGLPGTVVVARKGDGRVMRVKPSIVSGFLRDERFFTREEASRQVALEADHSLLA